MKKVRRASIAVMTGLICGIAALGILRNLFHSLSNVTALRIVFSAVILGFVIGISNLSRLNWIIHGLLLGFIFGLIPFSRVLEFSQQYLPFNRMDLAIFMLTISLLIGIVIELFTTVICGAKIET